MKIPALVTALALACGTAMAAGSGAAGAGKTLGHGETAVGQAEHSTSSGQPRDGLANKMKRGFNRMGEATRNTMHRIGNAGRKTTDGNEQAAGSDTRSMGSAGSEAQDTERRARIDQAYESWRSKQK